MCATLRNDSPLAGRRVVLTRPPEAGGHWAAHLRELGAEIVEMPLITIHATDNGKARKEIFEQFGRYDWIVFTSANGVRHFLTQFLAEFNDIRALGLAKLAVVGAATAEALRHFHLQADLVADKPTAQNLGERFVKDDEAENRQFLLITGNRNADVLGEMLETAGAIVDSLPVYETTEREPEPVVAADFKKNGADALIFASGSAAQAYLDRRSKLEPKADLRPKVFAIGPSTAAVLTKGGLNVDGQAVDATIEALGKLLVQKLGRK